MQSLPDAQNSTLKTIFSKWIPAFRRSGLILVSIMAFCVALVLAMLAWYQDLPFRMIQEGHFVETSCVVLYLVVTGLLIACGVFSRTRPAHPWSLGLLTFLFAAREMDWHRKFTTYSITKTTFYVSPSVSITEKLIVCIAIFGILSLIAYVVYHHFDWFASGVRAARWPVCLLIVAAGLIVVSKGIDSGYGSLSRNGLVTSQVWGNVAKGIEETTELFIPITYLGTLMTTCWFRRKDPPVTLDLDVVHSSLAPPERRAA